MIVIAGGPVRRIHPHRVADVSFVHHVVHCVCGEVVRVHRAHDEPTMSVDLRLADKYRVHRTGGIYGPTHD